MDVYEMLFFSTFFSPNRLIRRQFVGSNIYLKKKNYVKNQTFIIVMKLSGTENE